jgi:hypothetical protein
LTNVLGDARVRVRGETALIVRMRGLINSAVKMIILRDLVGTAIGAKMLGSLVTQDLPCGMTRRRVLVELMPSFEAAASSTLSGSSGSVCALFGALVLVEEAEEMLLLTSTLRVLGSSLVVGINLTRIALLSNRCLRVMRLTRGVIVMLRCAIHTSAGSGSICGKPSVPIMMVTRLLLLLGRVLVGYGDLGRLGRLILLSSIRLSRVRSLSLVGLRLLRGVIVMLGCAIETSPCSTCTCCKSGVSAIVMVGALLLMRSMLACYWDMGLLSGILSKRVGRVALALANR